MLSFKAIGNSTIVLRLMKHGYIIIIQTRCVLRRLVLNIVREERNAYRLLVGKPEGKRPLGKPRSRWVDNIRMDLGEVGWMG
jgi:hypothetical protein